MEGGHFKAVDDVRQYQLINMHNYNNWFNIADSFEFNTAVPFNQEGRISILASATYYSKSKKEGKDQESIQSSTHPTQDINGKVANSQ